MPSRDVDSARRAIDSAISGPRDRKSQALTKSSFGINTNGPIKTDAIHLVAIHRAAISRRIMSVIFDASFPKKRALGRDENCWQSWRARVYSSASLYVDSSQSARCTTKDLRIATSCSGNSSILILHSRITIERSKDDYRRRIAKGFARAFSNRVQLLFRISPRGTSRAPPPLSLLPSPWAFV